MHVLKKYDIVQKLGKGAYGIVWKAIDRKSGQTIALKKIFDAFQNATDAQRTFREIMFLQEMTSHENIIRLLNVIKATNDKDMYLVFEYMETDLHAVIRANILQDIHEQFIMYQLVKALKYMHSAALLHRDVKPSNLLLNSECQVKIADFGLARSIAPTEPKEVVSLEGDLAGVRLAGDTGDSPAPGGVVLTDYVATRWYRAPEILFGSTKYTTGVDMWGCGCILGELLSGKAVFPGTSTMNQLDLILSVTGRPSREDVAAIGSEFAATMLSELPAPKRRSLESMFPKAKPEAIDLMRKLLVFNPEKRLSAAEALRHPYVAQFHDPQTEPDFGRLISIPVDDNTKYSIEEYRARLYFAILARKKELKKMSSEKKKKERKGSSRDGKGSRSETGGNDDDESSTYSASERTTTTTQTKRRWWWRGGGG